MRIDIIKEAQRNIIEAAMKGQTSCRLDITYMFVTPEEEKEVVNFLVAAMDMVAWVRNVSVIDESEPSREIYMEWSRMTYLFDLDEDEE